MLIRLLVLQIYCEGCIVGEPLTKYLSATIDQVKRNRDEVTRSATEISVSDRRRIILCSLASEDPLKTRSNWNNSSS
jgi:hypothetical protein